jgi:hypothetical protein
MRLLVIGCLFVFLSTVVLQVLHGWAHSLEVFAESGGTSS